MRNLTINRANTFWGKLSCAKVYIEDGSKADLIISGHKCRLLGSIKPGEEKSFAITNDSCRIFVISDSVTKDFCNDFCVIPAGHSDIALSGANHFNPLNLNAFIFDGRPSREMMKNRRGNKKFGAIFLSVVVILLSLIIIISSCAGGKTFKYENMRITLSHEFKEAEVEGWEFCYASDDISVFGKNETLADYPILEGFTLEQYSKMLLSNLNLAGSVNLKKVNDYYYFAYEVEKVSGKIDLTYYVMTYEDENGFWLMTFSCPSENVEKLSSKLFKYADSVRFK